MGVSPLVSIGMPVFNGEKYIREALDSVLNQSLADFELIISDNASSDKTQQICEDYAARDPRIRYIRQDENIGAIQNFRFVLDHSKTDIFMWLAHDDYFGDSNYLSKLYSTLMAGYDFCFSKVKILNMDEVETSLLEGITERFEGCINSYDFCRQTVNICSYQIYGLYKKSFLIQNYPFIENCSHMKCYGEGLAVHAMTASSTPCYVPDVSLIYRRHSANASSAQNGKHYIDFLEFTAKIIGFYLTKTQFSCFQKLLIIKDICILHLKRLLILTFPSLQKVKNFLQCN